MNRPVEDHAATALLDAIKPEPENNEAEDENSDRNMFLREDDAAAAEDSEPGCPDHIQREDSSH